MKSELKHIEEIGFEMVGEWLLENNKIKAKLKKTNITGNTLYAFVSNGIVKYIGKTVRPLKKRLYGYENPGPSQFTNQRGNSSIQKVLKSGQRVFIYALPDNGLIHYGIFHLNLAAGLEDSLVSVLKPEWNKTGTN